MNIGSLPIWLGYILLFIGSVASAGFIAFLCMQAQEKISEMIRQLKYRHKQKHRFDKPPLAKCYCRDCENWHVIDGDGGKCWTLNRWTCDCWYCWDSTPRKKDPENEVKNNG